MKSMNAHMKKLAIVNEMDFHVVEEQTQAETPAAIIDNFRASVTYLYKNTDLFGSAQDITVPAVRYPQLSAYMMSASRC